MKFGIKIGILTNEFDILPNLRIVWFDCNGKKKVHDICLEWLRFYISTQNIAKLWNELPLPKKEANK